MLCVKPVSDEQLVNPVLEKYGMTAARNVTMLLAAERDRQLGFVLVEPEKDKLVLHAFEITDCMDYAFPTNDNMEIAEYLIRAAGSYALNRMLPVLQCGELDCIGLLSRFGFKQYNHKYTLELKLLFKKCENCGG